MHKQGEPSFRRHVKRGYSPTMVTISLSLKNASGQSLHSVCLAVTLGARTLSLLMDVGANNAFRFSCRAGTEPAPTTPTQPLRSTFPFGDASPSASNDQAPN